MTDAQRNAVLSDIRSLTEGKKVVFVSGNFNVVHPGHLRLLKFAADCGDFLVVGILPDDTVGNFVPENLRLDAIRSIGFVKYGFILRERPEQFIEHLMPHVIVKGKEHEAKFNSEASIVARYGGRLTFGSGDITFSSLDLLQREIRETDHSHILHPKDYIDRHLINSTDIKKLLAEFSRLRVAVIGDLIVDEYISCDPIGMSQEDPTIVVTPVQSNRFVGGAGIVAAHARGLGAQVQFLSVIGSDEPSEFARSKLDEYGVQSHFLKDESRPTTLKQRYRAAGKTLLRVSHLRQHDISREIAKKILDCMIPLLEQTDLLIFSDFNYGCLPTALVLELEKLCAARGVRMVADSQSSSQVGDISRFQGMMLMTPTEREARLALRDFSSGLVVLAEQLCAKTQSEHVAITLGAEGVFIFSASGRKKGSHTDQIQALNRAPKDISGAGDSLLTCSAMALAVGADVWTSIYLGSLAAACQVSRLGNIPLHRSDLEIEVRM